jgi:nucleoid DNA-binding protein
MATQMSKSQLIEKIATTTEVSKREVKNVMDTLVDVGHKELKKNGVFLVPGALAGQGWRPRLARAPTPTGEEMMSGCRPDRPGLPGQGRWDAVGERGR